MRCCQGVKDKEVTAGELAAAEEHISKSKFGQILLRRCAPVLMPDLILIQRLSPPVWSLLKKLFAPSHIGCGHPANWCTEV